MRLCPLACTTMRRLLVAARWSTRPCLLPMCWTATRPLWCAVDPRGFGKSMNLSMLRAFLERPAVGRTGRISFADAQIWDADGGRYRDEYACYPVISLDFFWRCEAWPRCCRRGCTMPFRASARRLLALLEAPDLARDKVRHVERVARGVASADEVDSVLGVLIELLEIAYDEQVVLLVDGYDGACSCRASARDASGADPAIYSIACCSAPLLLRAIRCG